MNKHGNLYWEFECVARYGKNTAFFEATSISVKSYDFKEGYARAKALINSLLETAPVCIDCAAVYLRDDGSISAHEAYHIYSTYHIPDEKVTAFFSAGADKCLRLTWRT